jgi:hypothetical protein
MLQDSGLQLPTLGGLMYTANCPGTSDEDSGLEHRLEVYRCSARP